MRLLPITSVLLFALFPSGGRAADGVEFFERKVRPLLDRHCLACHSAATGKVKGGLALDSRAGWALGGDSGPAVLPGKRDDSPLIAAVRYADGANRMPPKGKLPADEIAALEAWVSMGAPDPRDGTPAARAGIDIAEGRKFWSFRPVGDPKPPAVRDETWPAGDVDRFLLAAMEAKGVRPGRDADPLTLLRRISYDLTGLPPSADDVALLGVTQLGHWARCGTQKALQSGCRRLPSAPTA